MVRFFLGIIGNDSLHLLWRRSVLNIQLYVAILFELFAEKKCSKKASQC